MNSKPSDPTNGFALRNLSAVADGRAAAQEWFDAFGKDESFMSAIAVEVGKAYVAQQISFSAANSFMNALMARAEWEAPNEFWVVYVALEDFEVNEGAGVEAVQHVAKALSTLQ